MKTNLYQLFSSLVLPLIEHCCNMSYYKNSVDITIRMVLTGWNDNCLKVLYKMYTSNDCERIIVYSVKNVDVCIKSM